MSSFWEGYLLGVVVTTFSQVAIAVTVLIYNLNKRL